MGTEKFDSLKAAQEAGAVVLTYGNFINAFISFLITASILFFIVYQGSKLMKKNEKKEQRNTKVCPYCKSEIHKDAKKCAFCTSSV
ncbi:MAG: MscL family protein [Candidatus Dojkabacteria bacterium]